MFKLYFLIDNWLWIFTICFEVPQWWYCHGKQGRWATGTCRTSGALKKLNKEKNWAKKRNKNLVLQTSRRLYLINFTHLQMPVSCLSSSFTDSLISVVKLCNCRFLVLIYWHFRAFRLFDIGLWQTSVEGFYYSRGKMKTSVTHCLKIDTDVCKLHFLQHADNFILFNHWMGLAASTSMRCWL